MAGRPERPLDPAGGALRRLAYELRKLRVEAGSPTYREMARRSGCGASTLSQAAAGERFPSLPTLRAYVGACGGDIEDWERRWYEAAGQPEPDEGHDGQGEPPYRGLARYELDDRELYFGRDALVAQLTERVRSHRLVVVVGASGSGKSSLLRAGLIPALRDENRPGLRPAAIRVLTPGPEPATTHGALFEAAPDDGGSGGDTVVVVDQFEELYTLGADAAERSAFVDRILTAADAERRLRVVIGVRADFFGRVAEHRGLADAVRDATVLVAPMDPAALREAVVGPAAAAGLIVERSLTERIVRETGEQPGGLPLMSHVLLETWRRRRGRVLTEEMYEAAGGLHGAIAATAESVHARLTATQAHTARRILLRMVTPGRGVPDTMRPVGRAELAELDAVGGGTGEVLEQLVAARLLTADGDILRLAHEALFDAWPRYRGWIEEDRERLYVHRQLAVAARLWRELDRDPGALFRGNRLNASEATFATAARRASLIGLEASFLDASIRARDHEELARTRTDRRIRVLTTALALLLALASVAGGISWQQSRAERQANGRAAAAQRESLSRRLAAEADHLDGADTELSMLLAVRAYRTSGTPEAYASVLRAAAVPLDRRLVPPGGAAAGPVGALAFSHDGRSLAWGVGDGSVLRTDVASGHTAPLSAPGSQAVVTLAFAPGDRSVVSGYPSGAVRTTDATAPAGSTAAPATRGPAAPRSMPAAPVRDPGGPALDAGGGLVAATAPGGGVTVRDTASGRVRELLPPPYVFLGLSGDGRLLAARDGKELSVWDPVTGARRAVLPGVCACGTAVFSRDGRRLAVDAAPGITVWDLAAARPWRLKVTADTNERIGAFVFGSDGTTLVVGFDDAAVRVFDIAEGRGTVSLDGLGAAVTAMVLSPDGRELALGMSDGAVSLYDTTGALLPRRLTRPGPRPAAGGSLFPAGLTTTGARAHPTTGVAFAARGTELLTGTADGSVDRWAVPSGEWTSTRSAPPVPDGLPGASPPAQRLLQDRDGGTVALLAYDGTLRVWRGGAASARIVGDHATAAALSPDGGTVITSQGPGGTLERWGTAPGGPATPVVLHTGLTAAPVTIVFSPDGKRLAVNDASGGTTLLDAAKGATLRSFTSGGTRLPPRKQPDGTLVAFAPDGRTLASAAGNGTVFLWDAASGRLLADLPGGTTPVSSVAFSPDGSTVATGSADGSVRLIDVMTHQTRNTLIPGFTATTSVAFAPDGRTLATTSVDGTALLFHLRLTGAPAAATAVCTALARDLTPEERRGYLPAGPVGPGCRQ
ncbi:hypothetical protein [Streptomyces sp. NPDC049040]|uniref:nSTAND1 domain-containing NTPase n=1 Tax=Streptomyces sp. NPDC049040 TaxID=3365593 RepID=UPI0037213B6D